MRLTMRVLALVALALFLLGVVTVEVGRSGPVTTTAAAEADSFVDSSKSTTNYGTSSRIRLDSSPIERGYLRFSVPALSGSVTHATLRVFSNTTSATGFEVHQVPNVGWGEAVITYSNAPAFSATVIGTSGAVSNSRWSSVDVSSAVTGSGAVSFALTTTSTREISLSSRETGANAPQLVVDVDDTTAPSVTLASPADGSSTDSTPTFSGVAGTAPGDSRTVTVNVYAGASATGTPVQTRTTTAAANGSFSVPASPSLAPGTYTARAAQTDSGGNTGLSAPTTFHVVDLTPPVVTLTSPANGSSTSDATPTFAGVAGTATGDSSSVLVEVYAGTSATGTPVAQLIATVGSGGAYSVEAAPPLAEGTYTARARQTDASGNTGLSAPTTFTVDTTPPALTLTDPANGSSLTTSTPTFQGVAGTGAGDSSSVTVKVYPGPSASGTPIQTLTATAGAGGAYAVTAAALANGTYTARAEQRDTAGNTGLSNANTFTVTVTVTDQVLLAAGDIADCGLSGDEATAALVNAIPGATVATLGDNVYDFGTLTAYDNCYDPSWGAFKNRTRPILGDHDYPSPNDAPGFATYFAQQLAPFGAAASDPTRGWYSYDLGAWHVAVVNAACGGTNAPACSTAAQESWLRADLAASSSLCQIVMWHNARWSSGAIHGNDLRMQQWWEVAYDAGVDVVLVGHEHDYERFAPQDAAGQADAQYGVREFVVGTGGESHYGTGIVQPNSQVRNNDTFGVLKLTLHGSGYDWQFIHEAGKTFTDSGSSSCHAAPPPPPAQVPSVRSVSSNAGNALPSLTIPTPAGTTAGDLLVATVAHQGGSGRGMTPPAGWSAVPNTDVYEGTNARIHAWFKFAGASEPSSYTFTLTGGSQDTAGGIIALSGANAVSPINVSAGQSNGSTGSTSVPAPSVTTTVPNTLLLYAGALNVAAAWTQPPFMSEQFERATSGTYKVSIESATQPLTAAGATGTRTATLSTSGRSVGITFAIAPSS
jgi:hypothetical protein